MWSTFLQRNFPKISKGYANYMNIFSNNILILRNMMLNIMHLKILRILKTYLFHIIK